MKRQARPPKKQKLITVTPKRTEKKVLVLIEHTIPKRLETQKVHVTLKNNGKRIDRNIIEVAGTGEAETSFSVTDDLDANDISIAAFVGDDYSENLQHVVVSIE